MSSAGAIDRTTRAQRDLAALFDLQQVDDTAWLGPSDLVPLPQLFGGQLVGQSIVAAARSVGQDKDVHSVHTAFLSAGTIGAPVRYVVEEIVTGRSRATRQVDAWQEDRLVCRSLVSASADRDGIGHARPAPDTDPAEDSVPLGELAEDDGGLGEFWDGFEAIEVRVSRRGGEADAPHSAAPTTNIWMRAVEPLPADPAVHRAAVAYASDLMLMGSAVAVHGVPIGHESTLASTWWGVSLDHTLWFQGEVRGDEWLLYEHATPMAHASRALIHAAVFDRTGRPVCQVAQEAILRPAR